MLTLLVIKWRPQLCTSYPDRGTFRGRRRNSTFPYLTLKSGKGGGSWESMAVILGPVGRTYWLASNRYNMERGGKYVIVEKTDRHHLTQVINDNITRKKSHWYRVPRIRCDEQVTSSLRCASPTSITPVDSWENLRQTSTENSWPPLTKVSEPWKTRKTE